MVSAFESLIARSQIFCDSSLERIAESGEASRSIKRWGRVRRLTLFSRC